MRNSRSVNSTNSVDAHQQRDWIRIALPVGDINRDFALKSLQPMREFRPGLREWRQMAIGGRVRGKIYERSSGLAFK